MFSCFTTYRFYSSYTCCYCCFAANFKETYFTSVAHMCAATQLNGVIRVNRYHSYCITIFFTKQSHGTSFHCFIFVHALYYYRNIFSNLLIYYFLHCSNFFIRHFCKMREIKTQVFIIYQTSLLCHMCAQYLAQCCMHEMRYAVVNRYFMSSFFINCRGNLTC